MELHEFMSDVRRGYMGQLLSDPATFDQAKYVLAVFAESGLVKDSTFAVDVITATTYEQAEVLKNLVRGLDDR